MSFYQSGCCPRCGRQSQCTSGACYCPTASLSESDSLKIIHEQISFMTGQTAFRFIPLRVEEWLPEEKGEIMTEDEARKLKRMASGNLEMRNMALELTGWMDGHEGHHLTYWAHLWNRIPEELTNALNAAMFPVIKAEIERLTAEADAMPLFPNVPAKPYEPML